MWTHRTTHHVHTTNAAVMLNCCYRCYCSSRSVSKSQTCLRLLYVFCYQFVHHVVGCLLCFVVLYLLLLNILIIALRRCTCHVFANTSCTFFVQFELSMSNCYHHCLPHYIVLLFCSIEFQWCPNVIVFLCLTTHVCFFSFSFKPFKFIYLYRPQL